MCLCPACAQKATDCRARAPEQLIAVEPRRDEHAPECGLLLREGTKECGIEVEIAAGIPVCHRKINKITAPRRELETDEKENQKF